MYQSGFWTNHSTDLCLAQLIGFVATGMDKQIHTGMILVDLQKAFDTLDHGVLLEKMKYFGFRASVIKWFESYLSNRKFLVCIDNVFFEAGTLKYGVRQVSILGSSLFLFFFKFVFVVVVAVIIIIIFIIIIIIIIIVIIIILFFILGKCKYKMIQITVKNNMWKFKLANS